MNTLKDKIRCAVIAGSLDGKTFLCTGISRGMWRDWNYKSLCFDPYKGELDWGKQAVVFGPSMKEQEQGLSEVAIPREFSRFRRVISSVKPENKYAIYWDEISDTGGRDPKNAGLVTAARHNSNAVFLLGHSYATMLPRMRGSLSHLILGPVMEEDAKEWSRVMLDKAVMQATELKQYEFLFKRKHHPAKILRYSLTEIKAGVNPFL
ncbi:MAG TPA: hypothetical protein VL357_12815 [Rariglobus sp.]|nr:hypothetical protein [Rariglobus sp.]